MQFPGGTPGSVLIAHVGLRLAPWLLGRLPAAATLGAARILYLGWDFSAFPADQRTWLDHFDEVWVPSAAALAALPQLDRPRIRLVHPAVLPVEATADRARWNLRPDQVAIWSEFDAADELQRDDPWSAIEIVRVLCERRGHGAEVELVLRVRALDPGANVASRTGQLEGALREAVRELPVRLVLGALSPAQEESLRASCDLHLATHRADGVGLSLVRSLSRGIPVMATGAGACAEWLEVVGGVLLPFRLGPLGRNVGFLPGSAIGAVVDVERAAALLDEKLRDLRPPEPGWRIDAERIQSTFDPRHAAKRFAKALEEAAAAPGRLARPE